jgi:hypothetical protein
VEEIYGCHFFQFRQKNPQANEGLNGAMHSVSEGMTPAVTSAFDSGRFQDRVEGGN